MEYYQVNRFITDYEPKLAAVLRRHGKKDPVYDYANIIIHNYVTGDSGYNNNAKITFGNDIVIDGPGRAVIDFDEFEERELVFEMTAGINEAKTEGYKCGVYFLTKITFADGFSFTYPLMYLPELCPEEDITWEKIENEYATEDEYDAWKATYPISYALLHGATIEFFPTFYKLNTIECVLFSNSEDYGGCNYISVNGSTDKQVVAFAEAERRAASAESVQVDISYEKMNKKVPRIEGIYNLLDTENPLWQFNEEEKEELTNNEFHLLLGGNGSAPAGETNWGKINYNDLPATNYLFISAYCDYATYEEKASAPCRVYIGDTEETTGVGECAIILDRNGMDTAEQLETVYEGEIHTLYAVPTCDHQFVKWVKWSKVNDEWVSEDVSTNRKLVIKTNDEFSEDEAYYFSAYFGVKQAKLLHFVIEKQDLPGGSIEITSSKRETVTISDKQATTGYTFDIYLPDVIQWAETEDTTYDTLEFYLDEECTIPAKCIYGEIGNADSNETTDEPKIATPIDNPNANDDAPADDPEVAPKDKDTDKFEEGGEG